MKKILPFVLSLPILLFSCYAIASLLFNPQAGMAVLAIPGFIVMGGTISFIIFGITLSILKLKNNAPYLLIYIGVAIALHLAALIIPSLAKQSIYSTQKNIEVKVVDGHYTSTPHPIDPNQVLKTYIPTEYEYYYTLRIINHNPVSITGTIEVDLGYKTEYESIPFSGVSSGRPQLALPVTLKPGENTFSNVIHITHENNSMSSYVFENSIIKKKKPVLMQVHLRYLEWGNIEQIFEAPGNWYNI